MKVKLFRVVDRCAGSIREVNDFLETNGICSVDYAVPIQVGGQWVEWVEVWYKEKCQEN